MDNKFFSPSVSYAGARTHYAQPALCRSEPDYDFQFVFRVLIKPGTFRIGQQTISSDAYNALTIPPPFLDHDDDRPPWCWENEIEWYIPTATEEFGSHILLDVLVKATPLPVADGAVMRRRRMVVPMAAPGRR
jgi:hypothetical protein